MKFGVMEQLDKRDLLKFNALSHELAGTDTKAKNSALIICAGNNETFKFALPMGVGLVEMAINLSVYLQKRMMSASCVSDKYEKRYANQPTLAPQNPDKILDRLPIEIIFIGSAGLYRDGEILGIYESASAANIEISSLENKSYTPVEQKINTDVSYETKVNSSNFITTDQNLAHKLFAQGYTLENMEFYAVLAVASKFKLPARGIFVATNRCNECAHADFIANHVVAKERLETYLKNKGII